MLLKVTLVLFGILVLVSSAPKPQAPAATTVAPARPATTVATTGCSKNRGKREANSTDDVKPTLPSGVQPPAPPTGASRTKRQAPAGETAGYVTIAAITAAPTFGTAGPLTGFLAPMPTGTDVTYTGTDVSPTGTQASAQV